MTSTGVVALRAPCKHLIGDHSLGDVTGQVLVRLQRTKPAPHLKGKKMLALKSLVVSGVLALMVHPAMAANDGSGAVNGVQQGSPADGSLPPAVRQRGDTGIGANAATCTRPKLTPEQRAERKALREQRLAQGIQPAPRTAEQKARAASRRAALCNNLQPR
jgi:hypothetical protein